MLITVDSVEDFIQSLGEANSIFETAVRISKIRVPVSTYFELAFQATALVFTENDDNYLLKVGVPCGRDRDYRDDQHEVSEGMQLYNQYRKQIEDYCQTRGWRVLPGTIQVG